MQAAELRLSAGNERLEALLAQADGAAPELAAGLREELAARERRHAAQDAAVATIAGAPANLVVLEAESANPCAPGARRRTAARRGVTRLPPHCGHLPARHSACMLPVRGRRHGGHRPA